MPRSLIHRITRPAYEGHGLRAWIRNNAYMRARKDLGMGEEEYNNHSSWLIYQRENDGTGLNANTDGAWCVAWVCCKYELARRDACEEFGIRGLRLPWKPSRGALRLGRRIKASGAELVAPEACRPGDLGFKVRKGGGHGFWIDGLYGARMPGMVPTLEGNVGKFPSVVRELEQDPKDIKWILRP